MSREVREPGHDLVDVHVGRGAGPCLEDVDGELVVVPSLGHLRGRGGDGLRQVRVDDTQVGVDLGCGCLEL